MSALVGEPVRGRLVSLDALRGLAMVGMVLVNNPGTWSAVYPPLLHAPWHGWTVADLVFPFFLFAVGAAVPQALGGRLERGAPRARLALSALRRALVLFAIGLLLGAYPFVRLEPEFGLAPRAFEELRVMGVLQRIALCYLAAALLFLLAGRRTWLAVAAALVLGHWALLALVPVPGHGAGVLDEPAATLAAHVDRAVFGSAHLWRGAGGQWDPEGLVGTLGATATTLLGMEAGAVLRDRGDSSDARSARLVVLGAVLAALGLAWDGALPINKPLWTGSYAVFTGGLAMALLGLLHLAVDGRGHVRPAAPLVTFGLNALTVFVASGLLARTLSFLPSPTGEGSLQGWSFRTLFGWIGDLASPELASLVHAVVWVAAWYAVLRAMERRGIVIRV